MKFGTKHKWFKISYLEFFFWKCYFGHKRFYIHPHVPVDIHQIFFDFRFSSRKSQRQQKLAKKIIHFRIQFHSKHLTHFTNLDSLDIENNMLPKHSQKPFSLYKFSSKNVSIWCQKKHLHCTISWDTRTAFLNTLKANVCIFLYISLRQFLFKRRSRFYLAVWRLNNFFKGTLMQISKSHDILFFTWK